MNRYFLHCTDGIDMVLDGQGIRAETREEALRYASALSTRLMHSVPDYDDWESWIVCVYDAYDQMVGTVPFRDAPRVGALREITDAAEASPAAAGPVASSSARTYPSVRDVCRHVRSVCAAAAARFRRTAPGEEEAA
ncbi:MAG TPA: hypothetical protein VHN20_08390 [Beijerinckiaceae bacterium]|nr:hypothetical protein [Beijerinckiaceae bacterium]